MPREREREGEREREKWLVQRLPPEFAIHTSPPYLTFTPEHPHDRYYFVFSTSTSVSSHASVHVGMLVPACNEDGKRAW